MKEKWLGYLYGSAIGDAMGAPTELRSKEEIEEYFGGPVTTLRTPPQDTYASGRKKGTVTDAFSIPFFYMEEMVRQKKVGEIKCYQDALLRFGKSEYYVPFAGMTTRKVIKAMDDSAYMSQWDYMGHLGNQLFSSHYFALSTNGAALRGMLGGWIGKTSLEEAVEEGINLARVTHLDRHSLEGAGAAAAMVYGAKKGQLNSETIFDLAIQGAKLALEKGKKMEKIRPYPGPSVYKRLELTRKICAMCAQKQEALSYLEKVIGNGPAVAETLPSAAGIISLNDCDFEKAIIDGINFGNETAAIGSLIGGICGSAQGMRVISDQWIQTVKEANSLEIAEIGDAFFELLYRNEG